jgi:hypothetical protein
MSISSSQLLSARYDDVQISSDYQPQHAAGRLIVEASRKQAPPGVAADRGPRVEDVLEDSYRLVVMLLPSSWRLELLLIVDPDAPARPDLRYASKGGVPQ